VKLPIIVYEHGDTMIFASVHAAENYLEAIDVLNGEYVVYDSEGSKLQLIVKSVSTKVSIEDVIPPVKHPDTLRKILEQYLHLFNIDDASIKATSLSDLVKRSLDLSL
jgi:hypothetical protein